MHEAPSHSAHTTTELVAAAKTRQVSAAPAMGRNGVAAGSAAAAHNPDRRRAEGTAAAMAFDRATNPHGNSEGLPRRRKRSEEDPGLRVGRMPEFFVGGYSLGPWALDLDPRPQPQGISPATARRRPVEERHLQIVDRTATFAGYAPPQPRRPQSDRLRVLIRCANPVGIEEQQASDLMHGQRNHGRKHAIAHQRKEERPRSSEKANILKLAAIAGGYSIGGVQAVGPDGPLNGFAAPAPSAPASRAILPMSPAKTEVVRQHADAVGIADDDQEPAQGAGHPEDDPRGAGQVKVIAKTAVRVCSFSPTR